MKISTSTIASLCLIVVLVLLAIGCKQASVVSSSIIVVEHEGVKTYVKNYDLSNKRWIDLSSQKYVFVGPYVEGIAPVIRKQAGYDNFSSIVNGRRGYVNSKGRLLLDTKYLRCTSFANGVAIVSDEIGSGIIGRNGEMIYWKNEAWVDRISDDYFLVQEFTDDKMSNVYVLNKSGLVLLRGEDFFEGLSDIEVFADDMVVAFDKKKKSVVLLSVSLGKAVLDFDKAAAICQGLFQNDIPRSYQIADVDDGLALITFFSDKGDRIGNCIIDLNGSKLVLSSIKYEFKSISEGKILFTRRDKTYGYMTLDGREIDSSCYKEAYGFCENYARVLSKDGWRFIDESGNYVTNFAYDFADDYANGIAKVYFQYNGKTLFGFVNYEGEFVVPPYFEEPSGF